MQCNCGVKMKDAEIYLDKEERKADILAINANPFV